MRCWGVSPSYFSSSEGAGCAAEILGSTLVVAIHDLWLELRNPPTAQNLTYCKSPGTIPPNSEQRRARPFPAHAACLPLGVRWLYWKWNDTHFSADSAKKNKADPVRS